MGEGGSQKDKDFEWARTKDDMWSHFPSPASVSGPEAVCQVIGMYDYVAQNDDELAFQKGQVITVLNKDDCDWWKGELNGREGLFPSNYVKLTTDTDPSTQCEYTQTHTHTHAISPEWQNTHHILILTH